MSWDMGAFYRMIIVAFVCLLHLFVCSIHTLSGFELWFCSKTFRLIFNLTIESYHRITQKAKRIQNSNFKMEVVEYNGWLPPFILHSCGDGVGHLYRSRNFARSLKIRISMLKMKMTEKKLANYWYQSNCWRLLLQHLLDKWFLWPIRWSAPIVDLRK